MVPEVAFIEVYLCDREALVNIFRRHRIEAAMYLAANRSVGYFIAEPGRLLCNNVDLLGKFPGMHVRRRTPTGLNVK